MEPKFSNDDIVIVRRQPDTDSGQIVIAMVNGRGETCKQLKKYKNGISLISTNSAYEPQFFTNKEIENLPVGILEGVENYGRSSSACHQKRNKSEKKYSGLIYGGLLHGTF